ncbi:OLC1v1029725C1 [Oldenlandia corymbosa var. corymbosa]|uniref:OLC1v1029725C1 n=1 Tax=Oldenlandia corymbosa var. corymbosa TaxID=529605 RepID=A0AAV1CEG2_OLDCO|nr:OLC1v1029725C1 [Oldenlandia corymbosa var. corymbosa]
MTQTKTQREMEDLRLQFDELKTQVTEMNLKIVAELDNKLEATLDSKLESKPGAYIDKILASLNHQNQPSRISKKPAGENPNCNILGSGPKEEVTNPMGNLGRDRVMEQIPVDQQVDAIELYLDDDADTWFQSLKKDKLRADVRMHEPSTLTAVVKIAMLQEQQLEITQRRQKPSPYKVPRPNSSFSKNSDNGKSFGKNKTINLDFVKSEEDEGGNGFGIDAPELTIDERIDLNDLTIEEGSMHVLSMDCVKQTILLLGKIDGRLVKILVDTSSTESFVDLLLVRDLKLPYKESKIFTITVSNGNKISGNLICPNLYWNIKEYKFSCDLKITRLSKYGRQYILQGKGSVDSMNLVRDK